MLAQERRVLITGGAGFIGSNLTDRLLGQGHRVLCLDDLNDSYDPAIKRANISHQLENPGFTHAATDIRDAVTLERVLANFNPEIVVHLAARAGVRPSVDDPFLYESVNIRGTMNMLQASVQHKVQKFIYASSSSVYGINKKVPFAEGDPVLSPISPYAATKIAGEALCHATAHLHQLPTVALRFFTVYGPRQRPDLAIHKFVRLMYRGEPLPLYGDGGSSRDYTYVDDIVDGICGAINYTPGPYEVFNLGNSRTISLKELVEQLEAVSGRKAMITWRENQPGDVPKTCADLTKSRQLLNYNPSTSLQQGLLKFIVWFKNRSLKQNLSGGD